MTELEFQREAWGHYWRSGSTHSCFDHAGPVDTSGWWQSVVSSLSDTARVLDLACGASALGQWLLSQKPELRITGVDYVTEPPPADGVEVIGGISLETLPFEEQQFDAVLSQFGLEYASWEKALSEAARVVRPGGLMALAMHHAGSPVTQAARVTLDSISDLVAENGLFQAAIALAAMREANKPTEQMENLIAQGFQSATQRPMTPERQWALDAFAGIMEKQHEQPPAFLAQNTKMLLAQLRSMQFLLSAMLAAVLDEDALSDMVDLLAPISETAPTLRAINDDQGNSVAWMLSATKR